jgi:GT2 family glycosyltransferase
MDYGLKFQKEISIMQTMPSVAAVIVTYRNPAGLTALVADLLAQTVPLAKIIIIDNAIPAQPAPHFSDPRIEYHHMTENTGSAGGYYEGMKRAADDSDYLWTLDDDVRLPATTLEALLAGFSRAPGNPGALCCILNAAAREGLEQVPSLPWKGTLFAAAAVRAVGLPIKEFFMYAEDLEYGLRLTKSGFPVFASYACTMHEERENKQSAAIGTQQPWFYRDSFRLYYALRNEVNTWIRYRRYPAAARVICYGIKVAACTLVTQPRQFFSHLRAVAAGILHGLSFRLGRNPRFLPGGAGK